MSRTTMLLAKTLALLTSIIIIQTEVIADTGDELTRAIQQYPDALSRLEEAYSDITATGRIVISSQNKSDRIKRDVQISVYKDFKKCIAHDSKSSLISKADPQIVYCITPEGNFSVRRDSPEASYLLIDSMPIARAEASGPQKSLEVSFSGLAGDFIFAPFALGGVSISKLVRGSAFRFTTAEKVPAANVPTLKLTYEVWPKGEPAPTTKGEIEVLPEHGWVTTKHSMTTKAMLLTSKKEFTTTTKCHVVYKDLVAGAIPIPSIVTLNGFGTSKEFKFDEVHLKAGLSTATFSPESYGLPAFAGSEPVTRRTSLVYYLIIAAIVSAAAARYYKPRRAMKASPAI